MVAGLTSHFAGEQPSVTAAVVRARHRSAGSGANRGNPYCATGRKPVDRLDVLLISTLATARAVGRGRSGHNAQFGGTRPGPGYACLAGASGSRPGSHPRRPSKHGGSLNRTRRAQLFLINCTERHRAEIFGTRHGLGRGQRITGAADADRLQGTRGTRSCAVRDSMGYEVPSAHPSTSWRRRSHRSCRADGPPSRGTRGGSRTLAWQSRVSQRLGPNAPGRIETIHARPVEADDVARRIGDSRLAPQPWLVAGLLHEPHPGALQRGDLFIQ
jgi:hypothetical protein